MTIAENLKKMRNERGMSQEQLAELSGVGRKTISDIETDAHSNTTVYVLCQICKAFNVTPNDLIPEYMYK